MTQPSSQQRSADAPLSGNAPNAEQLRDPSPEAPPNASSHVDEKPRHGDRPGKYPAAKSGKGDPSGRAS